MRSGARRVGLLLLFAVIATLNFLAVSAQDPAADISDASHSEYASAPSVSESVAAPNEADVVAPLAAQHQDVAEAEVGDEEDKEQPSQEPALQPQADVISSEDSSSSYAAPEAAPVVVDDSSTAGQRLPAGQQEDKGQQLQQQEQEQEDSGADAPVETDVTASPAEAPLASEDAAPLAVQWPVAEWPVKQTEEPVAPVQTTGSTAEEPAAALATVSTAAGPAAAVGAAETAGPAAADLEVAPAAEGAEAAPEAEAIPAAPVGSAEAVAPAEPAAYTTTAPEAVAEAVAEEVAEADARTEYEGDAAEPEASAAAVEGEGEYVEDAAVPERPTAVEQPEAAEGIAEPLQDGDSSSSYVSGQDDNSSGSSTGSSSSYSADEKQSQGSAMPADQQQPEAVAEPLEADAAAAAAGLELEHAESEADAEAQEAEEAVDEDEDEEESEPSSTLPPLRPVPQALLDKMARRLAGETEAEAVGQAAAAGASEATAGQASEPVPDLTPLAQAQPQAGAADKGKGSQAQPPRPTPVPMHSVSCPLLRPQSSGADGDQHTVLASALRTAQAALHTCRVVHGEDGGHVHSHDSSTSAGTTGSATATSPRAVSPCASAAASVTELSWTLSTLEARATALSTASRLPALGSVPAVPASLWGGRSFTLFTLNHTARGQPALLTGASVFDPRAVTVSTDSGNGQDASAGPVQALLGKLQGAHACPSDTSGANSGSSSRGTTATAGEPLALPGCSLVNMSGAEGSSAGSADNLSTDGPASVLLRSLRLPAPAAAGSLLHRAAALGQKLLDGATGAVSGAFNSTSSTGGTAAGTSTTANGRAWASAWPRLIIAQPGPSAGHGHSFGSNGQGSPINVGPARGPHHASSARLTATPLGLHTLLAPLSDGSEAGSTTSGSSSTGGAQATAAGADGQGASAATRYVPVTALRVRLFDLGPGAAGSADGSGTSGQAALLYPRPALLTHVTGTATDASGATGSTAVPRAADLTFPQSLDPWALPQDAVRACVEAIAGSAGTGSGSAGASSLGAGMPGRPRLSVVHPTWGAHHGGHGTSGRRASLGPSFGTAAAAGASTSGGSGGLEDGTEPLLRLTLPTAMLQRCSELGLQGLPLLPGQQDSNSGDATTANSTTAAPAQPAHAAGACPSQYDARQGSYPTASLVPALETTVLPGQALLVPTGWAYAMVTTTVVLEVSSHATSSSSTASTDAGAANETATVATAATIVRVLSDTEARALVGKIPGLSVAPQASLVLVHAWADATNVAAVRLASEGQLRLARTLADGEQARLGGFTSSNGNVQTASPVSSPALASVRATEASLAWLHTAVTRAVIPRPGKHGPAEAAAAGLVDARLPRVPHSPVMPLAELLELAGVGAGRKDGGSGAAGAIAAGAGGAAGSADDEEESDLGQGQEGEAEAASAGSSDGSAASEADADDSAAASGAAASGAAAPPATATPLPQERQPGESEASWRRRQRKAAETAGSGGGSGANGATAASGTAKAAGRGRRAARVVPSAAGDSAGRSTGATTSTAGTTVTTKTQRQRDMREESRWKAALAALLAPPLHGLAVTAVGRDAVTLTWHLPRELLASVAESGSSGSAATGVGSSAAPSSSSPAALLGFEVHWHSAPAHSLPGSSGGGGARSLTFTAPGWSSSSSSADASGHSAAGIYGYSDHSGYGLADHLTDVLDEQLDAASEEAVLAVLGPYTGLGAGASSAGATGRRTASSGASNPTVTVTSRLADVLTASVLDVALAEAEDRSGQGTPVVVEAGEGAGAEASADGQTTTATLDAPELLSSGKRNPGARRQMFTRVAVTDTLAGLAAAAGRGLLDGTAAGASSGSGSAGSSTTTGASTDADGRPTLYIRATGSLDFGSLVRSALAQSRAAATAGQELLTLQLLQARGYLPGPETLLVGTTAAGSGSGADESASNATSTPDSTTTTGRSRTLSTHDQYHERQASLLKLRALLAAADWPSVARASGLARLRARVLQGLEGSSAGNGGAAWAGHANGPSAADRGYGEGYSSAEPYASAAAGRALRTAVLSRLDGAARLFGYLAAGGADVAASAGASSPTGSGNGPQLDRRSLASLSYDLWLDSEMSRAARRMRAAGAALLTSGTHHGRRATASSSGCADDGEYSTTAGSGHHGHGTATARPLPLPLVAWLREWTADPYQQQQAKAQAQAQQAAGLQAGETGDNTTAPLTTGVSGPAWLALPQTPVPEDSELVRGLLAMASTGGQGHGGAGGASGHGLDHDDPSAGAGAGAGTSRRARSARPAGRTAGSTSASNGRRASVTGSESVPATLLDAHGHAAAGSRVFWLADPVLSTTAGAGAANAIPLSALVSGPLSFASPSLGCRTKADAGSTDDEAGALAATTLAGELPVCLTVPGLLPGHAYSFRVSPLYGSLGSGSGSTWASSGSVAGATAAGATGTRGLAGTTTDGHDASVTHGPWSDAGAAVVTRPLGPPGPLPGPPLVSPLSPVSVALLWGHLTGGAGADSTAAASGGSTTTATARILGPDGRGFDTGGLPVLGWLVERQVQLPVAAGNESGTGSLDPEQPWSWSPWGGWVVLPANGPAHYTVSVLGNVDSTAAGAGASAAGAAAPFLGTGVPGGPHTPPASRGAAAGLEGIAHMPTPRRTEAAARQRRASVATAAMASGAAAGLGNWRQLLARAAAQSGVATSATGAAGSTAGGAATQRAARRGTSSSSSHSATDGSSDPTTTGSTDAISSLTHGLPSLPVGSLTGLLPGHGYRFRLAAITALGVGQPSEPSSVLVLPPLEVVTVPAPAGAAAGASAGAPSSSGDAAATDATSNATTRTVKYRVAAIITGPGTGRIRVMPRPGSTATDGTSSAAAVGTTGAAGPDAPFSGWDPVAHSAGLEPAARLAVIAQLHAAVTLAHDHLVRVLGRAVAPTAQQLLSSSGLGQGALDWLSADDSETVQASSAGLLDAAGLAGTAGAAGDAEDFRRALGAAVQAWLGPAAGPTSASAPATAAAGAAGGLDAEGAATAIEASLTGSASAAAGDASGIGSAAPSALLPGIGGRGLDLVTKARRARAARRLGAQGGIAAYLPGDAGSATGGAPGSAGLAPEGLSPYQALASGAAGVLAHVRGLAAALAGRGVVASGAPSGQDAEYTEGTAADSSSGPRVLCSGGVCLPSETVRLHRRLQDSARAAGRAVAVKAGQARQAVGLGHVLGGACSVGAVVAATAAAGLSAAPSAALGQAAQGQGQGPAPFLLATLDIAHDGLALHWQPDEAGWAQGQGSGTAGSGSGMAMSGQAHLVNLSQALATVLRTAARPVVDEAPHGQAGTGTASAAQASSQARHSLIGWSSHWGPAPQGAVPVTGPLVSWEVEAVGQEASSTSAASLSFPLSCKAAPVTRSMLLGAIAVIQRGKPLTLAQRVQDVARAGAAGVIIVDDVRARCGGAETPSYGQTCVVSSDAAAGTGFAAGDERALWTGPASRLPAMLVPRDVGLLLLKAGVPPVCLEAKQQAAVEEAKPAGGKDEL